MVSNNIKIITRFYIIIQTTTLTKYSKYLAKEQKVEVLQKIVNFKNVCLQKILIS